MSKLNKQLFLVTFLLMVCISEAQAGIDLSIPSPTVSARGDLYPSNPIIAEPVSTVMPPVRTDGMLYASIRAADFPQGSPAQYDFYLVLTSAAAGKTYYAEFDILKLLMGGFSLAEAITLGEAPTPFIAGLALESDIDIVIPIRPEGLELSQGGYHVVAVFTQAGTDRAVGNRAVDKIRVQEPVCCPTPLTP